MEARFLHPSEQALDHERLPGAVLEQAVEVEKGCEGSLTGSSVEEVTADHQQPARLECLKGEAQHGLADFALLAKDVREQDHIPGRERDGIGDLLGGGTRT